MEAVTANLIYYGMGISKSPMAEPKGYMVAPITNDDIENVLAFLRKFFFRDEPLNLCIGLLDEQPTCMELEKFCVEPIPDGFSLKAVSPSGDIIGVCLNGVVNRSDEEEDMECDNAKFRKIQDLLDKVYTESDIFGRFPDVDKFLDIRVASVDKAYRGRGIAKALFDETRRIAGENGFQMVKADATSHFTALAVIKLGFQCIYCLNYGDYKDEDGKVIFSPEAPHTCVKTFVYRIN
ncbi:arylalkylamine N-acetyltransferase 1 isoform X2 [Halyomorpha halys]|uniref:arylalkylamine N-acetyltransferase 1 isoform X2 n=1 Tax=Halyomorpha halys TaxID=286706 RepID=UPI0006D51566|nr:dopamine N-acetyltransferase-like isoform X2 [Halyomorpha halys]